MRNVRPLLSMILGLLVAVPASAAPGAKKDVCIVNRTGGGSLNTFIFRDVKPLRRGRVTSLHGLFFVELART